MTAIILAWAWQPIAPPLQIALGTGLLAAAAVFAYVRTFHDHRVASVLLLLMRLATVICLAVVLMGPSRLPPRQEQPQRPKLQVLVDTSQSMLTPDCEGDTRIAAATTSWLNRDQLAALHRDFDVELAAFDEQVRPIVAATLEQADDELAVGRTTQLASSVTSALSKLQGGDDGTAMLVISDGRDTEEAPIQPAAALAASKRIPVYTAALGGRSLQADVALLAVPMQEYLLPGEPGSILAKLYQVGLDQATTTLRLRSGDNEHEVPITFDHQRVVEVQLPIEHDQEGHYEYQVEVDAVDGEGETSNNLQTVFCQVQQRRIRVLMLEGQPFWDSKFLAQSLRKDERIELTHITQLSMKKRETIVTRVENEAPKVPSIPDEWSQYDIVVLGKSIENLLTPAAAGQLAEFVSSGGGHVVFARGRAYGTNSTGDAIGAALASIEPVAWGTGFVEDTTLTAGSPGRVGNWFSTVKMGLDVDEAFGRLPGFDVAPRIERVKSATLVLATSSASASPQGNDGGQPAIVTMNAGRGSVVGILGDGTWRWSLLPPDSDDLTGFYDTFWSNLVRWLTMGGDFQPGQQVSLQLSRTSARLEDTITADIVCKIAPPTGAAPTLRVTNPEGQTAEAAAQRMPGRDIRYRVNIEPQMVGVYNVTLLAPGLEPERQQSKFNVYDLNMERLQTSANPMPLRVLAKHSGGQFLAADQAAELPEILHRLRASLIVPPQLEYIWDHWLIMVLLLAWSGGEWILRRAVDLL